MSIKKYSPTTPGHRDGSISDSKDLKKPSEKSLLRPLKKKGGRSSSGRVTVRGRGGGEKRKYRLVDFKRNKYNVSAEVQALEYDPNRTAWIALIEYEDGEKSYIIAPQHLQPGDTVMSGPEAPLGMGNRLKLKNIPSGTQIYNVEFRPKQGGKVVRSAGSSAQILAHEKQYVHVKMPSKEIRKFNGECYATIGQVSNPHHRFVNLGKAGRARHKGRRPKVRGTAMAASDHPHGGGEGRTGTGRPPKTKWGKPAHGVKTRQKHKESDKFIVEPRSQNK